MNCYQPLLDTAIAAARAAGELQRRHFHRPLRVTAAMAHDIKLELDVRSQRLIERTILRRFSSHEILGEEGNRQSKIKNRKSNIRWVIDPIDGTVNFFYNIPVFCVSIAAQERVATNPKSEWRTVAGVIYDPMRDEMFSTALGQPTRLNGRVVRASKRRKLADTICTVAFFKDKETIRRGQVVFDALLPRVRKLRLLGAAALDLAYVACGRFDAYVEFGVKLWDIAAGLLLVENAGGKTLVRPTKDEHGYALLSMSGAIPQLPRIVKW
ncbi:MAG: inositol monophosphatase [Verrucomicrobia bacterium]|nr:inositol monophosphatase [Verrucomicrobiota bacterium]